MDTNKEYITHKLWNKLQTKMNVVLELSVT